MPFHQNIERLADHRVRSVSEDFLPSSTPSSQSESQGSPDGRWVVFVTCEGADECYLASSRRFAAPGEEPVTLDGPVHGYSAFGKVVTGMDTVDLIANAPGKPIPGAGGNRPNEPQVIERAIVVMAPSDAGTWQDAKAAK